VSCITSFVSKHIHVGAVQYISLIHNRFDISQELRTISCLWIMNVVNIFTLHVFISVSIGSCMTFRILQYIHFCTYLFRISGYYLVSSTSMTHELQNLFPLAIYPSDNPSGLAHHLWSLIVLSTQYLCRKRLHRIPMCPFVHTLRPKLHLTWILPYLNSYISASILSYNIYQQMSSISFLAVYPFT